MKFTETVFGHAQLHPVPGGDGGRFQLLAAAGGEGARRAETERCGVDGRESRSAAGGQPSTTAAGVQEGDERVSELCAGSQVEKHIAGVVRQADLIHATRTTS